VGVAARAAPGGARHGRRHLAGDRPFVAGIHVPAIGLRCLKRRDRDLSLSYGVPFAGAGSGARPGRHATDPFPFDGCADVLLPGRRLARICRAGRAAGGKPEGKHRSARTGCADHGTCPNFPAAAVAGPEKRPVARTCAPGCTPGSPGEAGSVRSQTWGWAFPGKKRMDGYPPAHGETSQGRSLPA
jgi:hypothetical protein